MLSRVKHAAGTEVGNLVGAHSPILSLTRSLTSTLDSCHGPQGPGARLVEFDDAGFAPAVCEEEVRE
jgi:hypothetical protein